MSRDKPWLKMWTEWLMDANMDALTLAEQGAWWRLYSYSHTCGHVNEKGKATGALVAAGKPLSLTDIMKGLKITDELDKAIFNQMVEKMTRAGKLHWNGNTLNITQYENEQRAATDTKEAQRQRQKEYREKWDLLIDEINHQLEQIPPTIDRLAQHEAIKQKLAEIGQDNGYNVQSEVPIGGTDQRRIDLCWLENGKIRAAFEIDYVSEKRGSLEKLELTGTPNAFIILRDPTPHVIRAKKREPEKNPSPPKNIDIEVEEEGDVEHHAQSGHGETVTQLQDVKNGHNNYVTGAGGIKDSHGKSVTVKELMRCYENYIGLSNPRDYDRIRDFTGDFERRAGKTEWIEKAFQSAPVNKRRWPYVQAILERYLEEGGPDDQSRPGGKKPGQGSGAYIKGDRAPTDERYRESLERRQG